MWKINIQKGQMQVALVLLLMFVQMGFNGGTGPGNLSFFFSFIITAINHNDIFPNSQK